MPKHVAELQQMSNSGPLTELFDGAIRAYVCGAPAAAFAMCRALLETVLKQSYLPEEFTEREMLGKLLPRAVMRHSWIPIEDIRRLVRISNEILHGNSPPPDEADL